jgi:hypothetical protein
MYDDDAVVSWLEIRRPWFDWEHTIRQLCIPLRRLRCVVGYAVSTPYIEYLHNSTVRTLSTLCPLARQELQRRILRRLFVPTDRICREHVHLDSTVPSGCPRCSTGWTHGGIQMEHLGQGTANLSLFMGYLSNRSTLGRPGTTVEPLLDSLVRTAQYASSTAPPLVDSSDDDSENDGVDDVTHPHANLWTHAHNPIHGGAQPLLLEQVEPSATDGIQSSALGVLEEAGTLPTEGEEESQLIDETLADLEPAEPSATGGIQSIALERRIQFLSESTRITPRYHRVSIL